VTSPEAIQTQEPRRGRVKVLPLPMPESPCPIRDVLAHVGGKWSMLTVFVLSQGDLRFGELRRNLPRISQRMLSQTLRTLLRDGLVERRVLPTTPPGVIYGLTDLGRSLLEPLNHMVAWANTHFATVLAARQAYFADAPEDPDLRKTAVAEVSA
jgi:DNA-binding HxlR family transcriptional regulator